MGNLFAGYDPNRFFDEMFASPTEVRPHYQRLFERYNDLTLGEFDRKRLVADNSFSPRASRSRSTMTPKGPSEFSLLI